MRFRDKVVWVTGASSGIGEAVAIAFSKEGARLVLSSRNAAELERVRRSCAGDGHRVIPLDLTDPDSFPAAVERAGHVDILVHSGGVSQRSLAADTDLATDRAIMDVNFFGTVALTKAVLPSMLAKKSGHIVPISSVVGYVGTPLRSTYAASKHALHGFFDSLRAEVAKDGIVITIVCPGYIRTNVSRNALTGNGKAFGKMDSTHERAMRPEEAARRIVKAVADRKQELLVGGKETWAVPLKRFIPRLVSRVVRMK
ncbi:MAG: short chain dehydrogenase [Acidobacteria bacterium]|nr:MAG: short chain dehydrogenase [Acidobacteriota bacterium]